MSGKSVEEVVNTPDEPMSDADNPAEARKWRTPGFQRMRLDWKREDRDVLNRAKAAAEGRLLREFPDAYRILSRVYDIVRTQKVDPTTGEFMKDQFGLPVWEVSPIGGYVEDFSRLGFKEKEDFLFAITTHLFEWQQLAADAWGEAMFAKGQWEERYAYGHREPASGTVEDRDAAGKLDARDERYFAIFCSMYSRKADALVRSLELLSQRIKDSLVG